MTTLYFDGACRGNGSETAVSGCGYIINDIHGSYKYLGHGTNNTAEYSGLINGLKYIIEIIGTDHDINIYGDSKLVIEQMKGNWKVKHPVISILFKEAQELCKNFNSVTFTHVDRSLNSKADKLANKSIDMKNTLLVESR
jgi:ribonuclease HI